MKLIRLELKMGIQPLIIKGRRKNNVINEVFVADEQTRFVGFRLVERRDLSEATPVHNQMPSERSKSIIGVGLNEATRKAIER